MADYVAPGEKESNNTWSVVVVAAAGDGGDDNRLEIWWSCLILICNGIVVDLISSLEGFP